MNKHIRGWYIVVLLLILYALLCWGARKNSFTSDEPAHIAVGYSILARGPDALWLVPRYGHPPLLNVFEAALLYLADPHIPVEQLDDWGSGTTSYFRAFQEYMQPVERTELTARMPIMWLTVLLGALISRWSRELWGKRAALLALVALVFDPLLLAHGRLATTDVGTIVCGTATLYLVWRWTEHPRGRQVWGIGFLLGLTLLAKVSGLFWMAIVGLLVLSTLVRQHGAGWQRLLHGLGMGIISLLVLWAGHLFTWGPVQGLTISLPAPSYWGTLSYLLTAAGGHLAFALERLKGGHWWWYFPLAFMIKNPLPLLLSLALGLATLLRRPFSWLRTLTLGLFPAFYTILAITNGLNIGYRHMLPIHPFLYLIIGGGVGQWAWGLRVQPWRRWLIYALGAWSLGVLVSIFPYEIAYFNELVGGPKNGARYLIDSNLDWGQGYKALSRYLVSHPEPSAQLGYLYNISPELYGIETTMPLPIRAPFHPRPGQYIISLTGSRYYPQDYGWFSQIEPIETLAYSFLVYDIAPSQLAWFAQCAVPVAPLSPDLVAWGFEQTDLRQVTYDCTNTWLYPTGGEQPGGYGLHNAIVPEQPPVFPALFANPPSPTDPFVARRLSSLRLSLNMRLYTEAYPAFVLYEQTSPTHLPPAQQIITLSEAEALNPAAPYQLPPVLLDGPLTFEGAMACQDTAGLDVETWWRVTASTQRPLSIMGHLLTAEGSTLAVADGLVPCPD